MAEDRYEPNLREAFQNWSLSDEPILRKLKITARNEWKKFRTRSNCCGNIDQPGC